MIQITPAYSSRLRAVSSILLLGSVFACNEGAAVPDATGTTTTATTPAGSATMQPAAANSPMSTSAADSSMAKPSQAASAGASATSSGMAAATASAGTRATAAAAGAQAGTAGAAMSGSAAAAGSGAAGQAATAGAAGAALQSAAGSGAAGQAAASDTKAIAMGLHELFLDAPCDSATRAPLEQGATCNHPPMTQHIEKPVKLGGEAGKKYTIKLRVRGIWEPTNIMGGMRGMNKDMPFTVGGMVTAGAGSSSDSINYQQYYIEVAEPKQTYWLNDYQYVAHDIHKADYEASITAAGGTQVKVVMNDGNEREIANFPKEMFSDVPPYDKMPSLGQSLRIDVLSVEPAP